MHLETKENWSEELGLRVTTPGAHSLLCLPLLLSIRLSLLLLFPENTSVENGRDTPGFSIAHLKQVRTTTSFIKLNK